MTRRSAWPLLLLVAAVAGCAPGATSFVHPEVDFGRIHRCAVLPFANLSSDQNAGLRMQSVFVSELLTRKGLAIIEPGEVQAALRELRLGQDQAPTPEQYIQLGKRISADAVFAGTIQEYGTEATGHDRTYQVTADFTLTETETGAMIWKAQVHETGMTVWRKLFGGQSASLYDVSRAAVRKAIGTLF